MSPEDGESAESGAPGQPSVRRRALGGVLSLAGRDIALKVLAFAGWIALARLLDPATFGLFAVVEHATAFQLATGAADHDDG